jgi:hypothetical protein
MTTSIRLSSGAADASTPCLSIARAREPDGPRVLRRSGRRALLARARPAAALDPALHVRGASRHHTMSRILVVRTGSPTPEALRRLGEFSEWFERLLAAEVVLENRVRAYVG